MGLRRDWTVMVMRRIVSTAVMLSACAVAHAGAQESGFIEVSGSGSVAVEADRAHVSFAVETRLATAAAAAASNADAMERVLGTLRSAGLEGLRLATFGYSLRPEYAQSGTDRRRAPVIDGYTAVNNVRATISDVASVGTLIDLAIQSGANRISGVAFSASNADAAQSEALIAAVEDARLKATAIANALDRSLGEVLEVRGNSGQPTSSLQMSTMEAVRASTPIEAGDQVVRANVTVRFALGAGDSPR